jgi:hypothetical protein
VIERGLFLSPMDRNSPQHLPVISYSLKAIPRELLGKIFWVEKLLCGFW